MSLHCCLWLVTDNHEGRLDHDRKCVRWQSFLELVHVPEKVSVSEALQNSSCGGWLWLRLYGGCRSALAGQNKRKQSKRYGESRFEAGRVLHGWWTWV